MEENLRGGGGGDAAGMHVKTEAAGMHVKTEALEENTSALVVGSQEPPAPCGDPACRGGGGGAGGGGAAGAAGAAGEQPAEEQSADTTTTTPVILYPVSSDRFFTTSGDGKTFLKIAPAAVLPPVSSEKSLPSGSDFSSKAVLSLIEAVGRRWGLYETRERSQLFQSVQEEMASKGHLLPVEKIRRKWNNLIVTYKRVKDRSRETGHAKTSWEFFDLMDATLCDTIGSQIISNKRNKTSNSVSSLLSPLTKIAAKPVQLPPSSSAVRPGGDLCPAGGGESAAISSTTASSTSVNAATVSPTNAPDLKPVMVLNGDMVTTSVHPASMVPAPSFMSSPCFTEAASPSPSLGSTTNTDLSYTSCKTPSFSSGVVPFRLTTAPLGHTLLSSSFPPSSSCLSSSVASSLPAGGDGQRGVKEQSSVVLFQEVLKQQEEQAYLDRVARRRGEAREKRRERREVRMSESLGRIASALELLSSKQDTVIALLQRLADRK